MGLGMGIFFFLAHEIKHHRYFIHSFDSGNEPIRILKIDVNSARSLLEIGRATF